jgi:hypothetical protein
MGIPLCVSLVWRILSGFASNRPERNFELIELPQMGHWPSKRKFNSICVAIGLHNRQIGLPKCKEIRRWHKD